MKRTGWSRSWQIFRLFFITLAEILWERFRRKFYGAQVMDEQLPALYRRQAVRIRLTAISLEGLLIKLGQFFSTRVDLLPREYTEELAKLQDEVPSVNWPEIAAIVEAELQQPIALAYREIEQKDLAAASLGQVHRAFLPTGERVAVKVMRPNIEAIIAADLKTLQQIIILLEWLTDWGKRFDLWAIYKEFSKTLLSELDYIQEGKNGERFSTNFEQDERVKIPKIYWSHTTKRVLTMELLEGYKITQVESWGEIVEPKYITELLVEIYTRQILEHGIFHADPHPGNIMVSPEGKLCLIDFGMVGYITLRDKEVLRELLLALGSKNTPGIVRAFGELGFLRPDADQVMIRRSLEKILEKYATQSIGSFSNEQWVEVIGEFDESVLGEYFQVPANYIFLGRTLGTLFGLCVSLEPDTQFISILEPHLKRLAMIENIETGKPSYLTQIMQMAATMAELPGRVQRTLTLAEQGNLHIRVDSPAFQHWVKSQDRALRFVGRSIIFAAFLVSSVILYVYGLQFEAHVNFFLAIVFFLYLLLTWKGSRS